MLIKSMSSRISQEKPKLCHSNLNALFNEPSDDTYLTQGP